MQRDTALQLFNSLDESKSIEFEGDPPTYDVRLDATVLHESGERTYVLRVTPAKGLGPLDRDDWQYVMELAVEHDVELDVQNAGFELR